MNNTKWRKLINSFVSHKLFPRFRVKIVNDSSDLYWEGGFPEHLPTFSTIEWIEFDPVFRRPRGKLVPDEELDRTIDLELALKEANVQYCKENQMIRVWGYFEKKFS